jgi:glucose/arabinose dehydrogenase/mono/diheme cytochrome c family protein
MRSRLFVFLIISIITLLTFSFKSYHLNDDPWLAPSFADTIISPIPFSPQVINEGEKLYNVFCVSCHGQDGFGNGQPGRFNIEPANFHDKKFVSQTDGAIFWKLTHGKGIMPAYNHALSEEKRWQIIAYIRQFVKYSANVQSKSVPIKNYIIDSEFRSNYFPIPKKISNANLSDELVFMVDTIFTGLIRPWSMVFLPGESVLVAERSGRILHFKNGVKIDSLSGNIPRNLRDIKLHPDFEKNKLVYLSFYIDPDKELGTGGYTALLRAQLLGNQLINEKIIYKAGPFKNSGNYFGSKIGFDDEGYLYFTVGIHSDRKNAQSLSNYDGKTMRLNDDGTIPSDNPFIANTDALPEIYTYGHRMHQGMRKDPITGRMLIVEFGELGGDELNVLKAGANYGWPIATFSLEYNGAIISDSPFLEGIEPPLHHFALAPSDFDYIYGNRYPSWEGNIFIGGLATKKLFRLKLENDKIIKEESLMHNFGRIRGVNYGPDHFLYLFTEDTGLLLRLIPLKPN